MGKVSGKVTDPSRAVIIGASVALTRFQTGARSSANSNEAEIHRFDAVDLGVHDLKVNEAGFKPFLATGLPVEVRRTLTIGLRLELGYETSTVSAEAESLTARDGALRGENFLPRHASQLPPRRLNPISLALTLPGMVEPSGSFLQSKEESTEFSVNGPQGIDSPSNARFGQPFHMPAPGIFSGIQSVIEHNLGEDPSFGLGKVSLRGKPLNEFGAKSVLFQALLTADIDEELGFRHTDKVGKTIYFDYCQAAPQ